MMVTWVTMNATKTPKVEYNLIGDEKFSLVQIGFSTIFIDGGKEKRTMFMNRVLLRNLKPGRAYGRLKTFNVLIIIMKKGIIVEAMTGGVRFSVSEL